MALAEKLENVDLSADILRRAVPQMSSLGIPVTPDNYAVWYEYFLESDLDLKRAIDRLISNKVEFTPEVNASLYKNFLQEQSPEAIQNIQIETQILINSLLNKVGQMSDGTKGFSSTLSTFEEDLAATPDIETLEKMINGLMNEVETVIKVNSEMEENLNAMTKEVNVLKDEMENLNVVAMTDQLTSLHNRRAFDSEIQHQISHYEETQERCSLLIVDIDNFKPFNDVHGHLVGDKVLAYVALALKQAVRGDDFVARYGGDEFVVLLPNTHFHDALQVAKNLRARVAERKLSIGKDNKLSLGAVTVSIGLTSLHEGDTHKSFFDRADHALLQAKNDGRNCVRGE
ncbi:GGDEF domain-containing protein [Shewanella gelidii]|nr:GGDEF domain-containing protein [Shewanella gelidii]MCL1098005.1 GGDEF domain-containing protein [Shewanella gelidii]